MVFNGGLGWLLYMQEACLSKRGKDEYLGRDQPRGYLPNKNNEVQFSGISQKRHQIEADFDIALI